MEARIKGRRYNTDTARFLGKYRPDREKTDPGLYEEDLYVTKTGNFFAHYHNGKGNENIVPFDYGAAKCWSGKYLDRKLYEEIFEGLDEGEPVSNAAGTQPFSLNIPDDIMANLKAKSARTGATMKWQIIKALRDAGY